MIVVLTPSGFGEAGLFAESLEKENRETNHIACIRKKINWHKKAIE